MYSLYLLILLGFFLTLSHSQTTSNSNFKIKLSKLSSSYDRAVVTLRNTCNLGSKYECIRLPFTDPYFQPTRSNLPYRVYLSRGSDTVKISGFFTPGPIVLDVEYLISGSILEERYSNTNISDRPLEYSHSNLQSLKSSSGSSYIYYGYFLSPVSKSISIGAFYDDTGDIYIDDSLYIRANSTGIYYSNSFTISNLRPYNLYITCIDIAESNVGVILYWNINGTYETIPDNYLLSPTRAVNSPILLERVERNYVCDDVTGLRCRECNGLCLTCEAVTSELYCESCKSNAYLKDRKCYCRTGYYTASPEASECLQCSGLCESCEAVGNEVQCISCKANSSFRDKKCYCIEGYYLRNSDSKECSKCSGLCNSCRYSDNKVECITCQDNSVLREGGCYCNDGYYLPPYNSTICLKCTGLCDICEMVDNRVECTRCEENSYIKDSKCYCYDGYYLDSIESMKCVKCTGLCKECEMVDNRVECTRCKDNAYLKDYKCYCNEGYYLPSISYYESYECMECTGLCDTCEMVDSEILCNRCKNNTYMKDRRCYCEDGFYLINNDARECLKCTGLCNTCKIVDNQMICNTCPGNSYLKDYKCYCDDGYYLPDIQSSECIKCIGLCESCEMVDSYMICNKCSDNSYLEDNKCHCNDGYYIPGSDSNQCDKCPDENCKNCDGLSCSECYMPWEMNDDYRCICPIDDYYIKDRECIPLTLSLSITSSSNSLIIKFNKPISQPLSLSDLLLDIQEPDLKTLLSFNLQSIISNTQYSILFTSNLKLQSTLNTTLTFKSAPKDRQNTSLSILSYSNQIFLNIEGPCIESQRLLSCHICIELGFEDIECEVCDEECRCITQSWEYCRNISPYVERSEWAYDMLSFNVYFNVEIEGSLYYDGRCEGYFTKDTMYQLGISPICRIDSSMKILNVIIGMKASIIEGPYQFRESSVISKHNKQQSLDTSILQYILLPDEFPDPRAVINIPTKITYCSHLLADGSLSFFNRRDFSTQWSISSNKTSYQLEQFNQFLFNLTSSLQVEISSDVIQDLTEIEIRLKVINIFGKYSISTAKVEISQIPVPVLKCLSGYNVEIPSSIDYLVHIDIKWPSCFELPYRYDYEWSIQSNSRIPQIMTGKQYVTIPRNTLNAGASYLVQAKVIADSPFSSTNQIELKIRVIESPIVIIIKGGNRDADVSNTIRLDGSSSYDPDDPYISLTYEWEYFIKNSPRKYKISTTGSILTLQSNTLLPNRQYIFQLTVSNPTKSSVFSVYLHTTLNPAPDIYIFSPSLSMNPSKSNILQSSTGSSNNNTGEFKWSALGGLYAFSSPVYQKSVAISPDSLNTGALYTFSFEYSSHNILTRSTIDIYVNTPPVYGAVEIIPKEGRALDMFRFIISGWEDLEDNYPLAYQLYKEYNSTFIKLSDLYYGNVIESILGLGTKHRNDEIRYIVFIYDSLGAYSKAYSSAIVHPIKYDEAIEKSEEILYRMKNRMDGIESLRYIPFVLIEISDTMLYYDKDSRYDRDREESVVEDTLIILEYYCNQMLVSSRESENVISALERITSRPQIINENFRDKALRYLNKAMEYIQGDYSNSILYQAINTISNLYSAAKLNNNTDTHTDYWGIISYYRFLNNLGLVLLRDSILNKDPIIIENDLFYILYQRVSPDNFPLYFKLGKAKLIFPSNISEILYSMSIFKRDAIDIILIYSNYHFYPTISNTSSHNLGEFSLKNVGVMFVNMTRSGYEDEYGLVIQEDPRNIELNDLKDPIQIHLIAEHLNLTHTHPNCTYLNETSFNWDIEGCWFKDAIPEDSIVICECNHMSFYSANDLRRDLLEAKDPNQAHELNPEAITEASIENSYAIVIAMSLIYIIHALLSYKLHNKDDKDLKRGSSVLPDILEENEPGFRPYNEEKSLYNTIDDKISPNDSLPDINAEIEPNTVRREAYALNYIEKDQVITEKKSFIINIQEIEDEPKTFLQLYIMSNTILDLIFVIDRTLPKIYRLSILFYSIYANIFLMGFFYNISSDDSIQDQLIQIQEAMDFSVKDVILFIYTKAIVLIPLKILKCMMRLSRYSNKRSWKNKLGVGMLIMGYLGCAVGIVLLGINFKVIYR